jgi:hypothetical protein
MDTFDRAARATDGRRGDGQGSLVRGRRIPPPTDAILAKTRPPPIWDGWHAVRIKIGLTELRTGAVKPATLAS